jgi:hypothetical protein
MAELIIRSMSEDDLKELKEMARKQFMSTIRPSKDKPRWEHVVAYDYPIYREISLGNMTQYKVGAFFTQIGRLFIGIENKGAYTFEGWTHFTYVQEKLNVKSESDARNIADWINAQLGHDQEREQGIYEYEKLFRENEELPESFR